MNHRLLAERDHLLRRLIDLELGLSLRDSGSPLVSPLDPWTFHKPTHPSRACRAAYMAAVCRLHPALAWSETETRERRQVRCHLHDAYANEDVDTIHHIRRWALEEGQPPVPTDARYRSRIRVHLAWLRCRIEDLLRRMRGPDA